MIAARRDDGRFGPFRFTVGTLAGQWRPVLPFFVNDPGAWITRNYTTFSQAVEEVVNARVWSGIPSGTPTSRERQSANASPARKSTDSPAPATTTRTTPTTTTDERALASP